MIIDVVGVLEDGSPRATNVPLNSRVGLRIPKGVDLQLRVFAVAANGAAVTLTGGAKATWSVKKNSADTQPLVLKELLAEPMTFTLTPADTKNLAYGQYVYDVWYTSAAGKRDPLIPLSPLVIEGVATLPP